MSVHVLLTHKELATLKETLDEKNINYMIDESYILGEFSKGHFERMKPIRTHVATRNCTDLKIKASLGHYISIEISQAILFIRNKIILGELKTPGDMVPVLIKDGNMYFWILGLITRLGGFHLCVRFFGENKWKKGRILYIGYQYTSRA